MDNSIINKAHQQQRKAENFLRYRKFPEAIECHKIAADFLTEALSLTDNPRSLESLRLQRDYHLRQQDVILIKREQYKNYKKAIENQRLKKLDSLCNNEYDDNQDNESMSLQVAIYRTMEETDSLLGLLFKKGSATNSDSESLKSFSTTDTDDRGVSIDVIDSADASSLLGSKHPKDDSTVIEELRILNGQLHSLVNQLVTQLDARVKEVDRLKETIKHLESDKSKAQSKNSNSLKVITDSSGGTSPYVFSPCSELSPDVHDTSNLPPLAPLELPNFDITNFMKNSANPVNTAN